MLTRIRFGTVKNINSFFFFSSDLFSNALHCVVSGCLRVCVWKRVTHAKVLFNFNACFSRCLIFGRRRRIRSENNDRFSVCLKNVFGACSERVLPVSTVARTHTHIAISKERRYTFPLFVYGRRTNEILYKKKKKRSVHEFAAVPKSTWKCSFRARVHVRRP